MTRGGGEGGESRRSVKSMPYGYASPNLALPTTIDHQTQITNVTRAFVAQLVEHVLGKNGVPGSSPGEGSTTRRN